MEMMSNHINDYCKIQEEEFRNYLKNITGILEKYLELKGDQATDDDRSVVCGLKMIYEGCLVEDITRDLSEGHITEKTIEKRVQLEADAYKTLIEAIKPNPMWKLLLEYLATVQVNSLRMSLMNQLGWLKSLNSEAQ